MEKTFITIHNLGPNANILFASDSITDILDYEPAEVLGKSSFDYFHPDEVPFARSIYKQGILLDKAAVLQYARIRSRAGHWIGCECVFTVVYDVLVAATSIYHGGEKSQRRAVNAPQIRRVFSCSPRDPRYHMLEHLSAKFRTPHVGHEPRAALILNRFTRSLGIMYATEAVPSILGLRPDQLLHKSFYECIQESCLADAIHCMENAKANDSIAYLRFWSRDPRRPEDVEVASEFEPMDEDEEPNRQHESSPGERWLEAENRLSQHRHPQSRGPPALQRWNSSLSDGGLGLADGTHPNAPSQHAWPTQQAITIADAGRNETPQVAEPIAYPSRTSATLQTTNSTGQAISLDHANRPTPNTSNTSSGDDQTPIHEPSGHRSSRNPPLAVPSVELEAVISCASDGLVVVIRRARPKIPGVEPPTMPNEFERGLFATPWSDQSVRPQYPSATTWPRGHTQSSEPQEQPLQPSSPQQDYLMSTIRDIGVFAWALVGINGNLASYCRGSPFGEAQPPDGLPLWDPEAGPTSYEWPYNQALRARMAHLHDGSDSGTSSAIDAPGSLRSQEEEERGRNIEYGGLVEGADVYLDHGTLKRPREGSYGDQQGSRSSTSLPHDSSSGGSSESSSSRGPHSDSSGSRPAKKASHGQSHRP